VALRYATRLNGFTQLAVTKLTCCRSSSRSRSAPTYTLPDGTVTEDFPGHQSGLPPRPAGVPRSARLEHRHLARARRRPAVPRPTATTSTSSSSKVGVPVAIVGIGQRRDQIITLRDVLAAA